ncbi:hypothetical protein FAI40_03440 [Acetobacteraceae bacterium]|nr:hypothetical protein FAI40_03440 [Acetobacteraceae bacterium]
MKKSEEHKALGNDGASSEKGLTHFLEGTPETLPEKKSFAVKTQNRFQKMSAYFHSPDFFVWIRNWLQANLFYLLPASFSGPLLTYLMLPPTRPDRLQLLEYGTLQTLFHANLISLALYLLWYGFERFLGTEKIEVKAHPFRRLFWSWVGASFLYVLPILLYSTLRNFWYFLDGLQRAEVVTSFVAVFWSVATVLSLLIMGITLLVQWVFRNLARRPEAEEETEFEISAFEKGLENKAEAQKQILQDATQERAEKQIVQETYVAGNEPHDKV